MATRIGVDEFPQIAAHLEPEAKAAPSSAQPWIEPSPAMAAGWPEARERVTPACNTSELTMPPAMPTLRLTDVHDQVRPLEEIERDVIRFAIAHYGEQMSEVARRLKIGRSTLYRKLEGLGLTAAPEKEVEPADH